MTCDPSTTISSADLSDLKKDITTIDTVVESSLDTTTTKDGKIINTLAGQLKELGFIPPIPYAGGIVFASGDNTKTVEEVGVVYYPRPSALPFTTSGTFVGDDDARFFVVQGLSLDDAPIRPLPGGHTLSILSESRSPDVYESDYYDSNKTPGSGAKWIKTGNTGAPGTTDFANSVIYNSIGDEYIIDSSFTVLEQFGSLADGSDDISLFDIVANNNLPEVELNQATYGWSGNLFLSDGQMITGKGSGNVISGDKGTRLKPLSSDARIRLFPHSKLSNVFIDGIYSGSNKAVDGIFLKPHEVGDTDYVAGDPVTASVIWTKVSNVNIQNFSNNISIEGDSFNLWFENLVSVAGRFKQVGGGETTLTACNLSDTTDQEIVFNDSGNISVHGGAIQNTNGGYPCIDNRGKMLLNGVYMENARAGANGNGYLIDNYGVITVTQGKSMAISEKGIRGRAGSKTYVRDTQFTGNVSSTNEVFNGRGDDNNAGGGYLFFENLTFRSADPASINYIDAAMGGYSASGFTIESGIERVLYSNNGENTTDLTGNGGTLTPNDTAEYLTNGESLRFIASSSAPFVRLTKTLRGLSGHLVLFRVAMLGKPSSSDNTRFLVNMGGDVTSQYVNVEFDVDSANGNTDVWYYITSTAVLDPTKTEHTITANMFTSLGGSGSSNGTNYLDRMELVDCGMVHLS